MSATLTVVLPIFALIFAGWLARRIGVLGAQATSELNRFVVYLALPALLFDIISRANLATIWQPGFVAAFGAGAAAIFVFTLILRLRSRQRLADAAIDGLNAGYANTGFMGFPLALAALGPDALAPTLVATILTACVLFAVAIVLIETGLQSETRKRHLAVKVGGVLLRNPLFIAPIVALAFPLAGWSVPVAAGAFLKLLGGAASPCALVTLGLFLAEKREKGAGDLKSAGLLVSLKLLVQPALTWVLAAHVFGLSALLTHVAVLLAALPTGTGPFMLAEFYRREAGMTSQVVLTSTVASVVTISGYLALAR